tara:strand:+ start:358 stop:1179 length:822 start_codon:yes stop_codon:yes gene_type:complete
MTNIVNYGGNQGTNDVNDADSKFSPFIWKDCPLREIRDGTTEGWLDEDDFMSFVPVPAGSVATAGGYYGFADTGGTVVVGDEVGGSVVLSSDGDNEGASIARQTKCFQISRSHGKLWFEARVKSSTITDTKHGFFLGLIDTCTQSATVPIAAAGTLADENFVGFHRLEGDGDQVDAVYRADGVTQVTVEADTLDVALVADTYTKLGMIYNPADYVLTFYQNGVKTTSYTVVAAAGTDFPNDVRLGFVFAVLNATGTTPGSSSIDKFRIAQLAV